MLYKTEIVHFDRSLRTDIISYDLITLNSPLLLHTIRRQRTIFSIHSSLTLFTQLNIIPLYPKDNSSLPWNPLKEYTPILVHEM